MKRALFIAAGALALLVALDALRQARAIIRGQHPALMAATG